MSPKPDERPGALSPEESGIHHIEGVGRAARIAAAVADATMTKARCPTSGLASTSLRRTPFVERIGWLAKSTHNAGVVPHTHGVRGLVSP